MEWQRLEEILTSGVLPQGTYPAAVFDPVRSQMLISGAGLYAWDCMVWTEIALSGPPPRKSHAMAYDSFRHRVVLWRGLVHAATETNDSLESDVWELVLINRKLKIMLCHGDGNSTSRPFFLA